MANASNNNSLTGSPATTLFLSDRAGGSDMDGALAVSVLNTGATNSMLVRCGNIHGASEFVEVPAGKSVTFECEDNGNTQIDSVYAKSTSGTTCTFTVTKWRG